MATPDSSPPPTPTSEIDTTESSVEQEHTDPSLPELSVKSDPSHCKENIPPHELEESINAASDSDNLACQDQPDTQHLEVKAVTTRRQKAREQKRKTEKQQQQPHLSFPLLCLTQSTPSWTTQKLKLHSPPHQSKPSRLGSKHQRPSPSTLMTGSQHRRKMPTWNACGRLRIPSNVATRLKVDCSVRWTRTDGGKTERELWYQRSARNKFCRLLILLHWLDTLASQGLSKGFSNTSPGPTWSQMSGNSVSPVRHVNEQTSLPQSPTSTPTSYPGTIPAYSS